MEQYGILLSVMHFLLENNNLKKSTIVIDHKKYRKLLQELFPDFSFAKNGNGFSINIKNSNHRDLVINNVNNLNNIKTDNVHLVPWTESNNPVVMYKYDERQPSKNVKDMISQFRSFSKDDDNKGWEGRTENKIIERYIKQYNKYNKEDLENYLKSNLDIPIIGFDDESPRPKITTSVMPIPQQPIIVRVEKKYENIINKCPNLQRKYMNVLNKLTKRNNILNQLNKC